MSIFLIYGATGYTGYTGYTGRMAANRAKAQGLAFEIAGRNHQRVEALATQLRG